MYFKKIYSFIFFLYLISESIVHILANVNYFRPQPIGCQLQDPLMLEDLYGFNSNISFYDTCMKGRKIDFTKFRGRNLYILGNSVYRHYAFAIPMLFDHIYNKSSIQPREYEKELCHGDLDDNSCDQYTENKDTIVRFMWKNFIGYSSPIYDDSDRDVCKKEYEKDCLPQLFQQANRNDILLIGSIPVDTECFRNKSYSSIEGGTWEMCQSSLTCDLNADFVKKIVQQILYFFPGTVH